MPWLGATPENPEGKKKNPKIQLWNRGLIFLNIHFSLECGKKPLEWDKIPSFHSSCSEIWEFVDLLSFLSRVYIPGFQPGSSQTPEAAARTAGKKKNKNEKIWKNSWDNPKKSGRKVGNVMRQKHKNLGFGGVGIWIQGMRNSCYPEGFSTKTKDFFLDPGVSSSSSSSRVFQGSSKDF